MNGRLHTDPKRRYKETVTTFSQDSGEPAEFGCQDQRQPTPRAGGDRKIPGFPSTGKTMTQFYP